MFKLRQGTLARLLSFSFTARVPLSRIRILIQMLSAL
jgi:hypothetical protein